MTGNLSTKEINYIRDHMSWELLQAKKCRSYAEGAAPEHAGLFNQLGNTHTQNYRQLLKYMENAMGGVLH